MRVVHAIGLPCSSAAADVVLLLSFSDDAGEQDSADIINVSLRLAASLNVSPPRGLSLGIVSTRGASPVTARLSQHLSAAQLLGMIDSINTNGERLKLIDALRAVRFVDWSLF